MLVLVADVDCGEWWEWIGTERKRLVNLLLFRSVVCTVIDRSLTLRRARSIDLLLVDVAFVPGETVAQRCFRFELLREQITLDHHSQVHEHQIVRYFVRC